MKLIILLYLNLLLADFGGGYAGSGFRYASNAREFSLAGALVADRTPGFFIFSNPSMVQSSKNNYLGISIQNLALDRSIKSISFSKKLPPNAGLGIAILQSTTNNIIGRDGMNKITEIFSANELEGILSFGLAFNSNFSIGINIKAFFNSIYKNYNGNGISSDLGFSYRLNRKLYFGAVIKNIKASYNWKILLGEEERSYTENFPIYYNFGISYLPIKKINIFFQQDIILLPNDFINYRTRLASEYKLKNKIMLRLGLKQLIGTNDSSNKVLNFTPTFGLGLPIQIWERKFIYLDYAIDPGIVGEGLSHLFSFSIKL